MVLFSIPDIRLFWSSDPRFLDQFKLAKISTFKPYSKYPASYRDISFWTPEEVELQENDFCDIVRDEAGDLVEDVKLVRHTSSCWDCWLIVLYTDRRVCAPQVVPEESMLSNQLSFNGEVCAPLSRCRTGALKSFAVDPFQTKKWVRLTLA
jgi:hypothetical protein